MSAHDGVDEHHVAVAAALQRARDAVAALAEPSPTFMDGMRSALQQAERRLCSSMFSKSQLLFLLGRNLRKS